MSPHQKPYDGHDSDEDRDPFDERYDDRHREDQSRISGYEATESVDLSHYDHKPEPQMTSAASARSIRSAAQGARTRTGSRKKAPEPVRSQQQVARTGPARPRPRTADKPPDPNIGRTLGSYKVLSLLGSGGMGQVYEAEHTRIGRRVALKLLRPEYAAKRDAVHRFFGEARAVNAIGHENIVDITDYVEADSGETFFIMELLQGKDLSDMLRKATDPIPLHRAMRIALQICEALDAAHAKDIIHRDLKPDNIFVVNDGKKEDFVKLLDFGVAKLQGELSSTASYQTAAGSVIGTPAYMSPEQASGIPVDLRTDIYSLGAIFYEMFTGHPVFNAKSFGEFVVKHMNDQPIPPRDLADAPKIPMALEAVILRCLEKDPADRYQNVDQLREDLARATATVETTLPQRPARQRVVGKASGASRPFLPILIGAGVLSLAMIAFFIAAGIPIFGGDEPAPPSAAVVQTPSMDATAPAPAPKVDITIRTTPKGAGVYRSGSTELLGRTPLTINSTALGPLGSTVALKLRLLGYEEKSLRVQVEKDADYRTNLVAIAKIGSDEVKPLPRTRRKRGRSTARRPKKSKPGKAPAATSPKVKPRGKIDKAAQVDPFAK